MDVNYEMRYTVLCSTLKEVDVGVTGSADMKVSEESSIATSKCNKFLGLITRNLTYKEKELIIPL